MQVVFETKRYSEKGWKFKVVLTAAGVFNPYWKHRTAKNFSGTFPCKSLEAAQAHFVGK
jgi:hypothetical protein